MKYPVSEVVVRLEAGSTKTMTGISLFSGIGALELGLAECWPQPDHHCQYGSV